MRERHSRQARLADVGEEGQGKIAALVPVVTGRGIAAKVEARYLAGAGVGRIVVEDATVRAAATEVDALVEFEAAFRDRDRDRDPAWAAELSPAARDVALGAYRALRALRGAVLPKEPA